MKSKVSAYILLVLICAPCAYSSEIEPFRTYSQSPIVQIFGLPAIGDSRVLKQGGKEMALIFDLANNYADNSSDYERIVIDGETYLLNLTGRFGVGERFEIGFELPYIFQNGGFLDSFIQDYHSTFGFPNAGREQAPNGRLLFTYERNGSTIFKVDKCNSGIGDIRLNAGYQLYQSNSEHPRAIALRTSLKLPTGDSNQLRGSGGADLALWLTGSQGFKTRTGTWEIFGGAGALGMTDGDLMPGQQRNAVAFGSIGAGWKPRSWLALKVQLDGQTAFYRNSDLDELSSPSAQVIVGGSLFFSDKIALEIGLSEDFVVKTAPDVVFHFALNYKF
ncbi:MAG: DUF3187 family protein [Syntrophaceae bacterium]